MNFDIKSNMGYLKLELFTKGLLIDSSCELEKDTRTILRTRGGLGSGLELILPGEYYVNAPVEEHFAAGSPYKIKKMAGQYAIFKDEEKIVDVKLPKRPAFYDKKTSTGKLMSRIGVMQGTYLAIYAHSLCEFWTMSPPKNCRFCSIGLNLGQTEDMEKSVQEVLEVVKAAREEEGITFVHFNSGFNHGKEIENIIPYVKAVKEKTGLLVGVQVPPAANLKDYDRLQKLGVNHVSLCLEFYNPESFAEYCPGKKEYLGQQKFLDALEYAAKVFGKGRVAGEIIVGLEPVEDTLQAIEQFARYGAVSTVCVFRPCVGTSLEQINPPSSEEIIVAFEKLYEVCLQYNIPIDIAPNIKVGMVLLPYECRDFAEKSLKQFLFEVKMKLIKRIFYLYFNLNIYSKRLFAKGE